MYLVVKFDNVARDIPSQNYDLKSVAKFFGISKQDRLVLGADEIKEYYYTNRELFNKYLDEDVRETYEIFKKLAPAYYYIKSIVPFDISFFDAFRMSTAAIWERILEKAYDDEYKNTLVPDSKVSYEGGLVIVNRGLYKNVYKVDVASLYPHIMLNYQVYSHKDIKKIGLIMLKAYTNLRLNLKKKAKEGDKEAELVQSALKTLINSLYGFYGASGYLFNDMETAAKITSYGRKILKFMIDYVEKHNGTVIECDTDGIFFSAANGEEIYQGLKKELEKINLDIELEYQDCVMFASDKKNYIIITQDGGIVKKGSKFAGRDKNWLWSEFVVEYIKRYVQNKSDAEKYKKEIRDLIVSGEGYDLIKVTKKISKNEVNIVKDATSKGKNITYGSIVTYAYADYKAKKYTLELETENIKIYDVGYYLNEFDKLVKEINDVINSTKQRS
jgi:DNA polymerase elongation subunit (family B)